MTPCISQTIGTLPKGRYTLTVDMQASNRSATVIRLGRQYVFAGEQKGYFADQLGTAGVGDTYPMQTISVSFEQQEDNLPITIGVSTEGAPSETWFKIDNFQLYRQADDTATGIQTVPCSSSQTRFGAVYDLSGRKVAHIANGRLPSGIYIMNNRKIVIK
jgi:hypothetical protein